MHNPQQPDEVAARCESLARTFLSTSHLSLSRLAQHASKRVRYRVSYPGGTLMAVYNPNLDETGAFIAFAEHFGKLGLPVPNVFTTSEDNLCYLEEDLGDTTLLDKRDPTKGGGAPLSHGIRLLYEQALAHLVRFQIEGAVQLPVQYCYQGTTFGAYALQTDFTNFEAQFLDRTIRDFDRANLARDFGAIINALHEVSPSYFLYRDFQSRNIMVTPSGLKFIDFQSGRLGPLQYDVASLLLQASAKLAPDDQAQLFEHYITQLRSAIDLNEEEFRFKYRLWALCRTIQVLATYGRAGLGEGNPYFLSSIPQALQNLSALLREITPALKLGALAEVANRLEALEIDTAADWSALKHT